MAKIYRIVRFSLSLGDMDRFTASELEGRISSKKRQWGIVSGAWIMFVPHTFIFFPQSVTFVFQYLISAFNPTIEYIILPQQVVMVVDLTYS